MLDGELCLLAIGLRVHFGAEQKIWEAFFLIVAAWDQAGPEIFHMTVLLRNKLMR